MESLVDCLELLQPSISKNVEPLIKTRLGFLWDISTEPPKMSVSSVGMDTDNLHELHVESNDVIVDNYNSEIDVVTDTGDSP